MSPMSKPSAAGLRRAVTPPPAAAPAPQRTEPVKPARVTLNLPPELYRQLQRWTDSAAETLDVPRVGVQDAMRAAIRVLTDPSAGDTTSRVLAELRAELDR